MNKFEALKFDDSNNGDSADDKEHEECEPKSSERSDEGVNGDGISEEEERQSKFLTELENKVVTVGEGEHPLQCPYAFWFSRRAPGKLQSSTNYADNIKLVGKFASTEESTTVTTKDGKRFQPHASRIIGRRARWLVTTVVYLEQEKLLALDKDGI